MVTREENAVLTGTSSGLGRYIYSRYHRSKVVRTKSFVQDIENILKLGQKTDLLIHCAFDAGIFVSDYEEYVNTNILYTQKLIEALKPEKVVYISSVNVYLTENTNYKLSKLISENIVRDSTDDHLILRCGAIAGPTMRERSVGSIKLIFEDKNPKIRLSNQSSFSYILQEDIFDFIELSDKQNITGTFDFVSSTYINLETICNRYGKKAMFGDAVYTTPIANNKKIKKTFPQADRTSEEVLDIIYRRINNV